MSRSCLASPSRPAPPSRLLSQGYRHGSFSPCLSPRQSERECAIERIDSQTHCESDDGLSSAPEASAVALLVWRESPPTSRRRHLRGASTAMKKIGPRMRIVPKRRPDSRNRARQKEQQRSVSEGPERELRRRAEAGRRAHTRTEYFIILAVQRHYLGTDTCSFWEKQVATLGDLSHVHS